MFLDVLVGVADGVDKNKSFAKHKYVLQTVVVFVNAIYRTQARPENIVTWTGRAHSICTLTQWGGKRPKSVVV